MQDIGIGDVLFILLILGVIHGIMTWVGRGRREANKGKSPPERKARTADPNR